MTWSKVAAFGRVAVVMTRRNVVIGGHHVFFEDDIAAELRVSK